MLGRLTRRRLTPQEQQRLLKEREEEEHNRLQLWQQLHEQLQEQQEKEEHRHQSAAAAAYRRAMLGEYHMEDGGAVAVAAPPDLSANAGSNSSGCVRAASRSGGSSSLDSAPPLKASRQASATGGRWRLLFRVPKHGGGRQGLSSDQPQQHQARGDGFASALAGSAGELRRRLLRYPRKDAGGPAAAPAAAGSAPVIAGRVDVGVEPRGRGLVRTGPAIAGSPQSQGGLLLGRSVRFGPAEVREFSPYKDSHSPRRATTDVYWIDENEGPQFDDSLESPVAAHRPLGLGRVVAPPCIVTQPERGSQEEEDCKRVPSFLQRDLAAVAAASVVPGGISGEGAADAIQLLPSGLTLDQAITFGHGQFASRSLSSPRNSDSQAMEDFLRATDSDPAVAKAAEEVVTGWCA